MGPVKNQLIGRSQKERAFPFTREGPLPAHEKDLRFILPGQAGTSDFCPYGSSMGALRFANRPPFAGHERRYACISSCRLQTHP